MRKRFLSIFLVLALCLAFLPVQVHAATITTLEIEGGISYKARVNDQIYIYRDTILVTGNGSINLDIPYKALSIDGGTAVDLDTIAPAEQWEAGHTYEITLQIATTGTDEFDTGMTCTIDGKDVAVNVISVDTAELTYRVYPATDATVVTPPAAKTGLVYNGDYQELTDPAVATGGTVLYSDSNAGPWSDEIRSEKNADTHDVWYMVQGDDSHFDTTPAGPVSVTIDLAPAPVLTATNPTIGYGSTINEGSLYTYTGLQGTDSITPIVTWATPLDTNTAEDYDYTVNATYDGGVDGNYTGPIAAVTGTLTVSPLPTADYTQNPVPTVPTYNGQAQELVTAGEAENGTMFYAVTGEDDPEPDASLYTSSIPAKTGAGTYHVWYKACDKEKNNESEPEYVSVTIHDRIVIHFHANGGTGKMDDQNAVTGDETKLNANTFSREGFRFTGWNTKANGNGDSYEDGGEAEFDDETDLYAQWEKNTPARSGAAPRTGMHLRRDRCTIRTRACVPSRYLPRCFCLRFSRRCS